MADVNDPYFQAVTWALKLRNRSPRTIQSYLEAGRLLAEFHGGADIAQLSRRQVEEFLLDQLERRSPATAAIRFRSLQQIYHVLVTEEMVLSSPMAGLAAPTVPVQPVRVLSEDDLRALFKAAEGKTAENKRDTALLRLLADTGMRLSEATNLTLGDLDMGSQVATVVGKGSKIRGCPFGARTGQALTRWLLARRSHPLSSLDALWLGPKGPMMTSGVTQVIRRRATQAGVGHVHPHMFRHSAAHYFMAAGGSPTDAMRLFGWSSLEMTQRYGAS